MFHWLAATTAGEKPQANNSAKEIRLVLSPQAHLQIPTQPIWDDSVEAIVTVAVPDSNKSQRHLCRIEASQPISLATDRLFKWALRRDTLMVLSTVPLQIRAPHKSFTGATSPTPLKLRIHYQNLDQPKKPAATATLELVLAEATTASSPSQTGTASAQSADSTQKAHTPATTGESSEVDFTPIDTRLIAIVAIIGFLFILLLLGRWRAAASRRQLSRKAFNLKNETTSPKRPSQAWPPPVAAMNEKSKNSKDEAAIETTATDEIVTPAPTSPSIVAAPNSAVPASASTNGDEVNLVTIAEQLQELSGSVQQIIANQYEANRQLEQMGNGNGFLVSQSPMRISLFDIISDEPADQNGDHPAGKIASPSKLRIQFAGDNGADQVAVNLASSAPVHIHLAGNDRSTDSLSVDVTSPSRLRIRFANHHDNTETGFSEALPAESNGHTMIAAGPENPDRLPSTT
jgi:hypothetical protein